MMRWPWSRNESTNKSTDEHTDKHTDVGPPDTPKEASMSEVVTPQPEVTPVQNAAGDVEQRIIEKIKTVYDPEIPVDIYELGLIYEIEVRPENSVYVKMTLTSPMCPVAETLPPEVELKVRSVEGVSGVELELVWDPPWHPDMMSEAAKLTLNM
jgi:FeS assembly SUF system protein